MTEVLGKKKVAGGGYNIISGGEGLETFYMGSYQTDYWMSNQSQLLSSFLHI